MDHDREEHHSTRARVTGLVGLVSGAVLLAACSSSPPSSGTSSTAPPGGSSTSSILTSPGGGPAGSVTVTTSSTKYGTVLATATGRILYLLTTDSANGSGCTGSCLSLWPPLVVPAGGHVTASGSAKQSDLTVITRSDGTHQVAYAGHPIYRYSGDTAAGQTKGEGVLGTWFVLSTSGNPVRSAQPSSTPTTASGGYGY